MGEGKRSARTRRDDVARCPSLSLRGARGARLSFLESSKRIRLLGAFKAKPASRVLACFARQQP
jgi:hypothetical protein